MTQLVLCIRPFPPELYKSIIPAIEWEHYRNASKQQLNDVFLPFCLHRSLRHCRHSKYLPPICFFDCFSLHSLFVSMPTTNVRSFHLFIFSWILRVLFFCVFFFYFYYGFQLEPIRLHIKCDLLELYCSLLLNTFVQIPFS